MHGEKAEDGNPTRAGLCRISMNPERSSSVWWDYARARFDAPASLRPMLDPFGESELYVTRAQAVAIRDWAAAVPDWDDAQPPIIVEVRNRDVMKV